MRREREQVKNDIEHTVGGKMIEWGHNIELAGQKIGRLIGSALTRKGWKMYFKGRFPDNTPVKIDPTILNKDGRLNEEAWRAKMARMGGDPVALSQAYYWTPEWQEGEREAEREFRAGQGQSYSSADEMFRDIFKDEPQEDV